MKRVFGLLVALLMLVPATVKADIYPVWLSGYSNSTTVGSEIVVKLTGFKNFDGKLEYDSEELEYVSAKVGCDDVCPPSEELLNIENANGDLTLKTSIDASVKQDIFITFKVNAAKSDTIKITYYPKETSVLYGEESKVIEYPVVKQEAPAVGNQEIPEVIAEPTKEEKKDNNDLCLYISWGLTGVFAISTICLAVSKKRK